MGVIHTWADVRLVAYATVFVWGVFSLGMWWVFND